MTKYEEIHLTNNSEKRPCFEFRKPSEKEILITAN